MWCLADVASVLYVFLKFRAICPDKEEGNHPVRPRYRSATPSGNENVCCCTFTVLVFVKREQTGCCTVRCRQQPVVLSLIRISASESIWRRVHNRSQTAYGMLLSGRMGSCISCDVGQVVLYNSTVTKTVTVARLLVTRAAVPLPAWVCMSIRLPMFSMLRWLVMISFGSRLLSDVCALKAKGCAILLPWVYRRLLTSISLATGPVGGHTTEKKTIHLTFDHNLGKYRPISNILFHYQIPEEILYTLTYIGLLVLAQNLYTWLWRTVHVGVESDDAADGT